jgi:hypothetical protein
MMMTTISIQWRAQESTIAGNVVFNTCIKLQNFSMTWPSDPGINYSRRSEERVLKVSGWVVFRRNGWTTASEQLRFRSIFDFGTIRNPVFSGIMGTQKRVGWSILPTFNVPALSARDMYCERYPTVPTYSVETVLARMLSAFATTR